MKKINSILKLAGLAACLLAAAHGALQAGAPLKINFQGRLDESGQPAEGSKSFVFKIYDVSSGGTPVWTSAAQSLALSQGVFSASLAAGTPAALSTGTFTGARYVEITVDGVTLSPRQEMVSAPYALVAQALAPDAVIPQGTMLAASVTDYHVLLTTGAIASGKFTDDRVYISTGAFYGGFGGADQLVQLDNAGKLPGVDGSALTSLNPANLSAAVAAAKGGTGLTAPGASGNLLRSDGTAWTSWTPTYLASYTETDPVFLAQKGAAGGVAPLGANAKLNTDYIAGTIVSTHIADASVGTADLASAVFNLGNFTSGMLATDYLAGTIVSTHIANASIGIADLESAVFNLGNFTSGMLSTDYLAGTIVSTHIAASGISAAKITSDTLNDSRLSANVTVQGNTFNGASQLVKLDASARQPALNVAGGVTLPLKIVTSLDFVDAGGGALYYYDVTANDYTMVIDATGMAAPVELRLPTAGWIAGRVLVFKRVDAEAVNVTIVPFNLEILEDVALMPFMMAQGDAFMLQSDGTDWKIIARY